VTTEFSPSDNPINARHAELFEDLGPPPDAVRQPANHPPEPPGRPDTPTGRNRPRPNRPGGRTKPGEQPGRRGRRSGQAGGPNRSGLPGPAIDPWSGRHGGTIDWASGKPPPCCSGGPGRAPSWVSSARRCNNEVVDQRHIEP